MDFPEGRARASIIGQSRSRKRPTSQTHTKKGISSPFQFFVEGYLDGKSHPNDRDILMHFFEFHMLDTFIYFIHYVKARHGLFIMYNFLCFI